VDNRGRARLGTDLGQIGQIIPPVRCAPIDTAVPRIVSSDTTPKWGNEMSSSALEQDFAESDNLGSAALEEGAVGGGSTALEQDFAESDNLSVAEQEEAGINLEEAGSGEPIEGLTVTATDEGWAVEGLSGGTVIEEGEGN